MGRELKRKEERKNKNNKAIQKNEEILDTSIKGTTVLKVVSSIILILLVLYYILAVFITKEIDISEKDNNSENDTTQETQNTNTNRILASNIFNQAEEVYYVYCYDFTDEDSGVKEAIDNSSKKIYKLNTKDGLNSNYITEEEGNKNATGLDNLKIKSPTLIEISGDKITGYYEGRSNIITFLSK